MEVGESCLVEVEILVLENRKMAEEDFDVEREELNKLVVGEDTMV